MDLEENVAAMTEQFTALDERMSVVASVVTKFGDRLQSTDAYRCGHFSLHITPPPLHSQLRGVTLFSFAAS